MMKLHLNMDLQDRLFEAHEAEAYTFNDTQDFSWKTTMKRAAKLGLEKKQNKGKRNETRI